MPTFRDTNEILDYAIGQEEESARFYEEQAEKMNRPEMRRLFLEFSREELVHKMKLQAMKTGQQRFVMPPQKVADLKIADYIAKAPQVGPYMTYAEVLTVAMLKEKEAFKLYTDLAAAAEDENLRNAFLTLASEEAKHKLRFELEYDQEMYSEN